MAASIGTAKRWMTLGCSDGGNIYIRKVEQEGNHGGVATYTIYGGDGNGNFIKLKGVTGGELFCENVTLLPTEIERKPIDWSNLNETA